MKFDDNPANRRAAKAAAECFVRLNPNYEKSPANHQAICTKIDELDLDPREVSAYETAWQQVKTARGAQQIIYEVHGETFQGLDAIEQMPAYEYGRRLQEDPRFREAADALLEDEQK